MTSEQLAALERFIDAKIDATKPGSDLVDAIALDEAREELKKTFQNEP